MIRVAAPPTKPVLVYDGDCKFCRRWIERWKQKTGDRIDYLPYQEISDQLPEIPRASFEQSVQLIEPDGSVYSGAEAVFRSLQWQGAYEKFPGLAPVSEWAYRLIASNRRLASALTPTPRSYILTRSVFVRFLGLIYFCAFVSLWTQITGLIGSRGIIPITYLMGENARANLAHNGFGAYWLLPTVFWFGDSDTALHVVCGLGTLLSILVVAGVATLPALAGLWILYLSLSVVCNVFLGYQWDALLLEVGFLAIWIAPLGSLRKSEPPRLVLWMFWWLLFRLMLCSGAVKLSSGDVTWHNLSALTMHYETQPLPTWIGWYAHQLPGWAQKFSCALMFGIEIGFPFLIWLGRRARQVACGGFVLLMILISLTGNYCFFNLLTVALCILLLDDRVVGAVFNRDRLRLQAESDETRSSAIAPTRSSPWRNWLFAPVATALILASVPLVFRACGVRVHWPRPVLRAFYQLHQNLGVFRSLNGYGLFAVMTTSRSEIIIEGSEDGLEWKAYEFKDKPGDLSRRPRFCWPHQPRVDWQMWFAALGNYQGNPWFINFCVRLLQNEPTVTRLLAYNPFPDKPPRYIRALVYDYHFTTFAERSATGHWWKRELKGMYCPVLSR